jgi:hypothetical protein
MAFPIGSVIEAALHVHLLPNWAVSAQFASGLDRSTLQRSFTAVPVPLDSLITIML